jgi:hypothetical protein
LGFGDHIKSLAVDGFTQIGYLLGNGSLRSTNNKRAISIDGHAQGESLSLTHALGHYHYSCLGWAASDEAESVCGQIVQPFVDSLRMADFFVVNLGHFILHLVIGRNDLAKRRFLPQFGLLGISVVYTFRLSS